MIRLARLLTRLGFRSMALSALLRYLFRRLGRSTAQRAVVELETKAHDRLPVPVAKAVSALPAEAKTAGASVVVAGRTAKKAVGGVNSARRRVRNTVEGTADLLRRERVASERRLRADYLADTVGPDAATDALLDLRRPDEERLDEGNPHDQVPAPVAVGRRRFRRLPRTTVARMQRSYRPEPKPWD